MLSNKDLKLAFLVMNEKFFGCRIPEKSVVEFKKIKEDGICQYNGGHIQIRISEDFKKHGDAGMVVLLHEMVHADLKLSGYTGYDHFEGHGPLFFAALDRLYRAGAYEGII